MDWTEKYRPNGLADLVGNGPSVKKLLDWAKGWVGGVPDKRAVILAGPPGVGKTSAALALANDMGWAAIELNASDARNAERIKRVATAGAMHQTFASDGSFHAHGDPESGRKLIILDEADNLYERLGKDSGGAGKSLSDAGGKTQIIATIRDTKQPIVLIVNDLYALQKGSGAALKSLAETLKWSRVNVRSMPKALDVIARAEGVEVDRPVLEALAQNAGGDLRAAVRDLQSLCTGKKHVTVHDLASSGYRDTEANIFDVIRHILKGRSAKELRREVMSVDATPADMVLWVDENLGKEYRHPEDLVRGYERLARADQFLGRTQRTQNYGLWSYASELATLGVMTAREHEYKGFVPFGFPQWLSKMSRSRGARQTKDMLAGALATATHQSKGKARREQVPVFEALFKAHPEFAVHQTYELELADDQVAVLLGVKPTAKEVKAIRAAVKEREEAGPRVKEAPTGGLGSFGGKGGADEPDAEAPDAAPEPEPAAEPESKPPSKPAPPSGGQKTLF